MQIVMEPVVRGQKVVEPKQIKNRANGSFLLISRPDLFIFFHLHLLPIVREGGWNEIN